MPRGILWIRVSDMEFQTGVGRTTPPAPADPQRKALQQPKNDGCEQKDPWPPRQTGDMPSVASPPWLSLGLDDDYLNLGGGFYARHSIIENVADRSSAGAVNPMTALMQYPQRQETSQRA